jgi:hypothetical protein
MLGFQSGVKEPQDLIEMVGIIIVPFCSICSIVVNKRSYGSMLWRRYRGGVHICRLLCKAISHGNSIVLPTTGYLHIVQARKTLVVFHCYFNGTTAMYWGWMDVSYWR